MKNTSFQGYPGRSYYMYQNFTVGAKIVKVLILTAEKGLPRSGSGVSMVGLDSRSFTFSVWPQLTLIRRRSFCNAHILCAAPEAKHNWLYSFLPQIMNF